MEDVAVPDQQGVGRPEQEKPGHPAEIEARCWRREFVRAPQLERESHAKQEREDRDELVDDEERLQLEHGRIEHDRRQPRDFLRRQVAEPAEEPEHVGQQHPEQREPAQDVEYVDPFLRIDRSEVQGHAGRPGSTLQECGQDAGTFRCQDTLRMELHARQR